MKLAQILATSPLPGGVSARQMPGGANLAQMPASVSPVAQGLADVGATVGQLGQVATRYGQELARQDAQAAALLARAEEEKRKHQEALDASTAVSQTLDTMDQAEQTFKLGQRDETTGEITVAPLSSQEYMPAWLKLREKLTQDALAKATTPEAKLVTAKLLEAPVRERQHAARKYSNELFVGHYTVQLEDELTSLAQREVTDPQTTPEGGPLWETRAMALLASAQGVLGPEKVRQARDKFTTMVDTAKARRLGLADPQAAIDALEAGQYRLPQDKADLLATGIMTKWQNSVRQEEAAATRRAAEWEKAWHGYQSAQHTEDYLAVTEGTLSVDTIKQHAREWQYTTAQTKELLDLHDKPAPEAKGDPGTTMRVLGDVSSMTPTITEREIKTLMANGQLTTKDGTQALGTLTARRRQAAVDAREIVAQGHTAATEARTALKYDQSEAEAQLKAAMGIPDILPPNFSPEVSAAYSQARQKLANTSAAFPSQGGKENPLTAIRKIIPEAQQAAGLYGRVKEADLIRMLPPDLGKLAAQGPDGFLAAARALDAQRKTLGEAEFGRIAQTFAELRALYRDLQGAGIIQAPTPSTAAPGGTFKVPKAGRGAQ